MISDKKKAANRQNALMSTGPKSERGKNASRKNALKHGIFSKELYISDQDRPEYDDLRSQLLAQFAPATPARALAAEEIITSAWNHKLALRLSTKHLSRQFQSEASEEAIPQPHSPTTTEWYGANSRAATAAIKLLDSIEGFACDHGFVQSEMQEPLIKAFGQAFWDDLNGMASYRPVPPSVHRIH